MNKGQKVMLVAVLPFDGVWGHHLVPPIGAIGEISKEIDEYGEYDVIFYDYPHPAINDPAWIVYKTEIVPIDDINIEETEKVEAELLDT